MRRILTEQDERFSRKVLSRGWKLACFGKTFAPRMVYIVRKGKRLRLS